MSCSLNSLEVVILGISIGLTKRDTRSLDSSSNEGINMTKAHYFTDIFMMETALKFLEINPVLCTHLQYS